MKKFLITLLCLTTSISSAFADHWTAPSANDYEDRAPLLVQLYLGPQRIASANDNVEIAAFINGQVRGQAFIGATPTTSYTLLEVRGNISDDTGKTITFKAFYKGLEYELKKTETWNYEASAHATPFTLNLDPLTEVKLPSTTELEGTLPFTYNIGNDISYVVGGTEQKTTETSNSKLVSTLTYTWDFANSEAFFSVDDKNILTAKAEVGQGYLGLTVSGEIDATGAAATSFSTYTSVFITATAIPPTSISITPTSIEASIGDNIGNIIGDMVQNRILKVTILPDNATDQSWTYNWVEAQGINDKGTIEAAGTYTVLFYCNDYPNISTTMTIHVAEPITIQCPESIELFTTHSTTLTLTASGDGIDPSLISIEFDETDGFGTAAVAVPADDTGLVWNCTGRVYGTYSYRVLYNGEMIIDPSIATYEAYVGGTAYINAEVASEAGWDWISINALPVRTTALPIMTNGQYIDEIKNGIIEMRSQTQLLYNDPKNGIFGDITELTPAAGMYKVKSEKGMSINLGHNVYAESTYQEILPESQTMNKGYNWISYVSCLPHSLESGWVEGAQNGDMIIGKDNFATYSGGSWVTSKTNPFSFKPGKGYIYFANTAGTQVNFNGLGYEEMTDDSGANIRKLSQLTGHTVDVSQFADNMPIIASLDGIENPEDYVVAAFVGDECRGFGTISQSGNMFINAGGTMGEQLEFKVYNIRTGEEINISNSIPFSSRAGSIGQPIKLSGFDATGINDIKTEDLKNYEIYDASGRRIHVLGKGINILKSADGKAIKIVR